jgi:hypothetical protein
MRVKTLQTISCLSLLLATIVFGRAGRALGWELEFEVSDQQGRAIAQERFDAIVTIGENTYGGSMNAESRLLTEYLLKDLPDSMNGCTVKVLPVRSCFEGGAVELAECGGSSSSHVTMNWKVYTDRSPKVSIRSDQERTTELIALRIPHPPPVPFTGSVLFRRRPVRGALIKALDGHDGWRTLASVRTDENGTYHATFSPKCPNDEKVMMILYPNGSGYQGGRAQVWSNAIWGVDAKNPPTVYVHSNGGPSDVRIKADPLKASDLSLTHSH